MSQAGECCDNAFMESCFGMLETEPKMAACENVRAARAEIGAQARDYNLPGKPITKSARRRSSASGCMALPNVMTVQSTTKRPSARFAAIRLDEKRENLVQCAKQKRKARIDRESNLLPASPRVMGECPVFDLSGLCRFV